MQKKSNFIPRITKKAVLTTALLLLVPTTNLLACGVGAQGGADYTPQRRGGVQQQMAQQQALSAEQAQQIVLRYVKPINSNLTVGEPNDAGAYYEIDLLSADGEIVQVIGVDKYTGRMQPLS